MGVIAFFYAIDSLYADRRDRSVLFWKSLPLSDAETVLSKFTVAIVVIPLVALVGALLATQLLDRGRRSPLKLAIVGEPAASCGSRGDSSAAWRVACSGASRRCSGTRRWSPT